MQFFTKAADVASAADYSYDEPQIQVVLGCTAPWARAAGVRYDLVASAVSTAI